jgi:calcium-dependent protein kinase
MEKKLIIGNFILIFRASGVILYILLCGRPPFYGKDIQAILAAIKKGIYTLDREPFYKCSNEAKDLLSKLLVKDPQKRYTALKAYEHPWTRKEITKSIEDLNVPEEVFRGLQKLVKMKKYNFYYLA